MKYSKSTIMLGFKIEANGIVQQTQFQKQELSGTFHPIPVTWEGKAAQMYIWNYTSRKTPVNQIASSLIQHPGFTVRGPVILVTGAERWAQFTVPGSQQDAAAKLKPLAHGFNDLVIYRPGGRWKTHQNIYVRDPDDAFAVRMEL